MRIHAPFIQIIDRAGCAPSQDRDQHNDTIFYSIHPRKEWGNSMPLIGTGGKSMEPI